MTETAFTSSTAVTPTSSNKVFACSLEKHRTLLDEQLSYPNNNHYLVHHHNHIRSLAKPNSARQQQLLIISKSRNEIMSNGVQLNNRKIKQQQPQTTSNRIERSSSNIIDPSIIPLPTHQEIIVVDTKLTSVDQDQDDSNAHQERGLFLTNNEKSPNSETSAETKTDLSIAIPNSNCVIVEENSLAGHEENSFSSVEFDKVLGMVDHQFVVYKDERITRRDRSDLRVHDLARKQPKLLDRKINNYPRLIIAIATFYVLPVIQLVLLYQTQLNESGNEDSCYFNFLCMVKSGPFAAFNNIFSNVGYILLGIMFIIVVKKRSYSYAYMRKKYPMIMSVS